MCLVWRLLRSQCAGHHLRRAPLSPGPHAPGARRRARRQPRSELTVIERRVVRCLCVSRSGSQVTGQHAGAIALPLDRSHSVGVNRQDLRLGLLLVNAPREQVVLIEPAHPVGLLAAHGSCEDPAEGHPNGDVGGIRAAECDVRRSIASPDCAPAGVSRRELAVASLLTPLLTRNIRNGLLALGGRASELSVSVLTHPVSPARIADPFAAYQADTLVEGEPFPVRCQGGFSIDHSADRDDQRVWKPKGAMTGTKRRSCSSDFPVDIADHVDGAIDLVLGRLHGRRS